MQKFITFNDTAGRSQFINCLHLIRFEIKESANISGLCVKFFLSSDKDIEWNKGCDNVKSMKAAMESKVTEFLKNDARILNLAD
jgi:hypothetical protein